MSVYQTKAILRPGDAHHKILILLKGHFAIYKNILLYVKWRNCTVLGQCYADVGCFLSMKSISGGVL